MSDATKVEPLSEREMAIVRSETQEMADMGEAADSAFAALYARDLLAVFQMLDTALADRARLEAERDRSDSTLDEIGSRLAGWCDDSDESFDAIVITAAERVVEALLQTTDALRGCLEQHGTPPEHIADFLSSLRVGLDMRQKGREQVDAAIERARLELAIQTYGSHTTACDIRKQPGRDHPFEWPCSCGFDDVLADTAAARDAGAAG